MKYGGQSKLQQTCAQCGASPDTHSFPFLENSEKTDKLMGQFLAALTEVDMRGVDLKKAPARFEIMAGVVIGELEGGQKVKYIALSSYEAAVPIISRVKSLGKDVSVAKLATAAEAGRIMDIRGHKFTPTIDRTNMPNALGQCAAQKCLVSLFAEAKKAGKKVVKIALIETFWRSFQPNPDPEATKNQTWSTITAVESCRTCKQVIPQMLCDKVDAGSR